MDEEMGRLSEKIIHLYHDCNSPRLESQDMAVTRERALITFIMYSKFKNGAMVGFS